MTRIALTVSGHNGCSHHRATLPARFLAEELAGSGVRLEVPDPWWLGWGPGFDVAVGARALAPDSFPVAAHRHAAGLRVWWETDDDFLAIPDGFPTASAVPQSARLGFDVALGWAERVAVTTGVLRQALGHPGKTSVLPNLVDADAYGDPRPRSARLTLLWAGCDRLASDFDLVVPALRECRRVFGNRLDILVLGYGPPNVVGDPAVGAVHLRGCPVGHYPAVLRRLAPDVAVCPLDLAGPAAEFNRCRSAVKWMEMTLAGAAVVATAGAPYGEVVRHGETGWLCATEADWTATLPAVLASRERGDAADAARGEVLRSHCWQSEAARRPWLDWFAGAV